MGSHRLGVARAVVGGTMVVGDVIVDDGRVRDVGVLPAAASGTAVPGFVDVQINGFAGVDFTTTDVDGYGAASRALARHGVTAFAATIPTAPPERYRDALTAARAAYGGHLPGARLLGVHLEGPFLSAARKGAHRVEWLRPPEVALVDEWLGCGPVRLMTLAPELDGALELIAHLRRRGVVVSLGHTDATAEQAHAGFDAGATMVTHLWNAQRPIASREPAVGGAALSRPDVFVGVIADLVHVARETLLLSIAAADERIVLVTDAVAAAGELTGPGDGARLPDGTLAGSTCPMDRAVRNLVTIGVPLERAVVAAATAPARALGDSRIGLLQPGRPADMAVLDDGCEIVRTLVAGREVSGGASG